MDGRAPDRRRQHHRRDGHSKLRARGAVHRTGRGALFSTIGTQAATTIQNARLFQEARLRATELAALNELSQTLAAQLSVNQVLHEVWQGVSHLLDTTNFYIALYDREREEVSFPINASESVLDKEIEVMPADQGLTGYIIRTRQPLLIAEDTTKRVEELGLDNVGGNSQSYLGVPLILGEQVLGVMAIQSLYPGAPV